MTLSDVLESTPAAIIGVAALVTAVGYLGRLAWRAGRSIIRAVRWLRDILTAIFELVDGELTHNHGSSIKDDVYGTALAVGTLQREFEDVKSDLYNHLAEKEPETP